MTLEAAHYQILGLLTKACFDERVSAAERAIWIQKEAIPKIKEALAAVRKVGFEEGQQTPKEAPKPAPQSGPPTPARRTA